MPRVELNPKLVFQSIRAATDEECLGIMARQLVELGYAKPSFPDAVIARERVFPTGLPTSGVGVAIPHADAEHVIRPGLAVGILAETVSFALMGGDGERVPVDLVIMLAINDPGEQIEMLQLVARLIQKPALLSRIKTSPKEEVIALISESLSAAHAETSPLTNEGSEP